MKKVLQQAASRLVFAGALIGHVALAAPADRFGALDAWAKQASRTLRNACQKSPAAYFKRYDELESAYMTKSAELKDAEVKQWAERAAAQRSPSAFLDLGREVWPLVASPGIPNLKAYVACGELSDQLHETLAAGKRPEAQALTQWEACLELTYRGNYPTLTKALKACVTRLSRK